MKIVLSIDGGGIRGIIPAEMTMAIEKKTGKKVHELFDLIVGTSTGGIIGIMLSLGIYTASEVADLYVMHGKDIFERSFWKGTCSLVGLADEKYSSHGLEYILQKKLGNSTFEDVKTNLLVTAYDIEDRHPVFFKSWKSESKEIKLKHAARATSAAPTYFEPVRVESGDHTRTLVDGGVCVNNPGMCAYVAAKRLWPDEEILLVSLGTGELTRPIPYEDAKDWGLAEWAIPVMNVMFSGQSETVNYQLHQILGSNLYYRFQKRLSIAKDDMDDASTGNIVNLQAEGKALLQESGALFNILCMKLVPL